MIHRMTPFSNKRLILLYTTLTVLPVAGGLSFRYLPPYWAMAVLALCLILARGLYRLAKPYLRSTLESQEDRIIITVPNHPPLEVRFNTIDLAGEFRLQTLPALFLYEKTNDRLFTFPKEYTGYEELRSLFASKLPFETLSARSLNELKGILRERYIR
ncbi:MAG: hypothetical protein SNJ78_06445 [Spirochaetales bacterium]